MTLTELLPTYDALTVISYAARLPYNAVMEWGNRWQFTEDQLRAIGSMFWRSPMVNLPRADHPKKPKLAKLTCPGCQRELTYYYVTKKRKWCSEKCRNAYKYRKNHPLPPYRIKR